MTLVITILAAAVSTLIWYGSEKARQMKVSVLCWLFWGASLMWLVDAVVEYMKTLVTVDTTYDSWCAGHADAFTPEQQRGSEVFLAAKCMDCHAGPVLGGRKVSRGRKVSALRGLGLRKAYLTKGKIKDLDAVVPLMPGGDALLPEDRKALVTFLKAL